MPRVKDLTGQKYNMLTIIKQSGINKQNRAMWLCRCDCGNEKILAGHDIINGSTKSCGCLAKETRKENFSKRWENKIKKVKKPKRIIKYGKMTRHLKIYKGMKDRCYNPKNKRYKDYGGRGIKICDEWLKDYNAFLKWALENGYDENLTIDRIDVNGNYEPSNCRWATSKQQAFNRRSNHRITINGENKTITEWSEIRNIKITTICARIRRGMNEVDAIITPLKTKVKENAI